MWVSLTFTLRVWGSLITLKIPRTVRLTQSYARGVRLSRMLPLWGLFTITLQVWGSLILEFLCEAHSYPRIWCSLTFKIRVWQLCNEGEAHSHLHYEYEAHPQLCNEGEAHLLGSLIFLFQLPHWGWLTFTLWVWALKVMQWVTTVRLTRNYAMDVGPLTLIYHCEAHSNAIGVRLTHSYRVCYSCET